MKTLKIIGLIIFLAGFTLFNALFFVGDHFLTLETAQRIIDNEFREKLFKDEAGDLFKKELSNLTFVKELSGIFERINDKQLQRYQITEEDITALVQHNPATFSLTTLDSVFRDNGEVSIFKKKSLRDFGGRLDGSSFSSPDDLHLQLEKVASTIYTYGIINTVGFDRYIRKDLTYALTKASAQGPVKNNPTLFLFLTVGLSIFGALLFILPKCTLEPGIKNNGIFFNAMKNTGWLGILTGSWLIIFYIVLYFFPEYLTNWVIMVDPVSLKLNGHEAGRFFLYGFLYTLSILVMGIRMLIHYRHSNYQLARTLSVMFFQTAFAFLIPEILIRLNQPYFDFKNIWPLDYDFFFDNELDKLIAGGGIGIFMLGWGIALVVVAVPVLVYFFGKRWYCSWVCGCGGLAETLGDPYRQLSNKTLRSWKIERWMIHGVFAFAIIMTIAVLHTYFTGSSWFIFFDSYVVREVYGVLIGAGFAGVVGTGFYPLMGNRVWCRFGCPLAAYLGLIQRFKSRFRITTNGAQCISCGNCSTYCEMGIDVRWYAQRGQNIVRSSCVGCGICSAVCPRGVLKLESKEEAGRFGKPILIGNNNIKITE